MKKKACPVIILILWPVCDYDGSTTRWYYIIELQIIESYRKKEVQEESLNLNIINAGDCKVWGKLNSYQNSVLYSKF